MIRKTVSTSAAPAAVGPYAQGVVWERMVFTSGQVALDPSTASLVSGGIEAETRRALDNLRAVLEAGGSGLDHVLKTTVYLADMSDFAAMNAVYAEYFPGDKPARSTIGVARLPLSARVEIEAVAVTRGETGRGL
jgi:2-iminobutanoate/2-iminopropanoate deaminase